jgi:hypothetical protein
MFVTDPTVDPPIAAIAPRLDPLRDLGLRSTPSGGMLRVWSANATSIELCI